MTPLTKAGMVLGLGLGGFLDGIVLHQILGWHHLVCTTETCQVSTVEALKRQNTQDGFFHLAVWIFTLIGVVLLFRAAAHMAAGWSFRALCGAMLGGWGLFNFVEGLVDHHIFGIHHVLPGSPHQTAYDLLFLASGAVLGIVGWLMARQAPPKAWASD